MRKLFWHAGLLVVALGCSEDDPDTPPIIPAEPDPMTEEMPNQPVDETPVGKLVEAVGGQESLDAITGLRIVGQGSRSIPHEGARPSDEPIVANSFARAVSIDLAGDALRVDTDRDIEFLFPGNQVYSDIVQGNLGASTQPFFGMPLGALGSDKVASIKRQEMLLTPHYLLSLLDLDALMELEDVELDGAMHHQLMAAAEPAPITLFVNAETGELSKLETLEHDFYKRDVTLEVYFGNWQAAADTAFPRELRVVRDGLTLFTEEVDQVEINPSFDADTFAFPDGVTPSFDEALFERGMLSHQWYYLLDSIGLPLTGVDVSITPTEVEPGVVQLVGATHHSFLVEQEAGIVLVDAPLYEDRGRALFDFIADNYGDKPITHVVASHFHEDHVAGIREVLGSTEAALVVHESVEEFWRDVISAPSTLQPDALAESPREVTILTVEDGGELTLEDATRPVTLYHLDTSHAADMLLTHETASNTVFVVDIYSPGNAAQLGAADLDAALTEYAVPTEELKIVGGHGDGVHDYAALQAALQAP